MPRKTKIEELFRKNLGRRTADALLAEMDKMILEKKSTELIEKMLMTRISAHIEDNIVVKIAPTDVSEQAKIRVGVHAKFKPLISVFHGTFVPMIRVRK